MRLQNITFFTIFLFSIAILGCTNTQNTKNAANTNSTTTNLSVSNTNNPLSTTKTPEAATSNNAPTLAPVVQNYYEALKRKDETAARKFLSQTALKYWQDEMKSEKKNSLIAILEDNESPVEEKREVRNERIESDTAIAELKGGSLGVWTAIKFVKENGEWKFASPKESLSLQDIPKTSNSNAAK